MNEYTEGIVDITFFTSLMRDTLAYIVYENVSLVQIYKDQQHGIKTELEIKSPFNQLLESNGETGKKFKEHLLKFYDFLFNKEQYITLEGEKVIVKHEYDLMALDYVSDYLLIILPLMDQMIEEYRKIDLLEDNAYSLSVTSKDLAVVFALLTYYVLLERRYFRYNYINAKQESGYEEESKLLIDEMNQVIKDYSNFRNSIITEHQGVNKTIFLINQMILCFTGRDETIKSLEEAIEKAKETRKEIFTFLDEYSKEFNKYYVPMIKAVYEKQQEAMKKYSN